MSKKVESDNPLVDKKIVKKTLQTHAYSTPWDQPIYQEVNTSNIKYSKIESVLIFHISEIHQKIKKKIFSIDLIYV